MRRPRFLPLTFVLATITAVALLGAGAALSDAPAPAASTDAGNSLVHRFYDAVNIVLRTGDPTGLDAVVAADLVTHDALTGTASGRATFADQLLALRAIYPALQLEVDGTIVDGDLATVRVSTRGADRGRFVGLPLDGTAAAREAIDLIRLADGQVAERWEVGDAPARLQPLASAAIAVPPAADVGVALERLTVAPGARVSGSSHHAPVVIAPEAGTLQVDVRGPVQLIPAAGGSTADAAPVLAPSANLAASPGDLVVFLDGAEFTIENAGETPAVTLGVRLAEGLARPWSVVQKVRISEDEAGKRAWPPGIAVDRLADGLLRGVDSEPASIALGRVTLAPGVAVGIDGAAGSAVLVVEDGTLGLDTHKGTARVRRGADGAAGAVPSAPLAAGDRAVVQAGATTALRNVGQEPLVLLLLSVVSDAP